MASKWEDLETLIGKGKIDITEPSGAELLNTEFQELWETEKEKDALLGAAIRWAVQVTPRGGLKLVLQGLPGDAWALWSEPGSLWMTLCLSS